MLTRLGLTPYSFRATSAYYLSFVGLGVVTASPSDRRCPS